MAEAPLASGQSPQRKIGFRYASIFSTLVLPGAKSGPASPEAISPCGHIFAYQSLSILLVILLGATKVAAASPLPAAHFRLMEAGIAGVESRLKAEPNADLAALETQPEWKHFPYAILAP